MAKSKPKKATKPASLRSKMDAAFVEMRNKRRKEMDKGAGCGKEKA